MARASSKPPSAAVIYGDEDLQKSVALREVLDRLLPPEADRGLALCEYDGEKSEEQGGPAYANVADDLRTLPFLAERRVVLIRDADKFISAAREKLEKYFASPSESGTLVLVCRSFPKTTRLYKAIVAAGGELTECKRLTGRALADFLVSEARARGKRLDAPVAARLIDLIGPAQGLLATEIEKLSLYVGDRAAITDDDVSELVGRSREERVFAAMESAGLGKLRAALEAWEDVLRTDPAAVYKALGGAAFVVRRWLAAHEMLAAGESVRSIAPRMMMWGRERELETLLTRLPPSRCARILAAIADLDAQAKVGQRSIETGVAALLIQIAAPAA